MSVHLSKHPQFLKWKNYKHHLTFPGRKQISVGSQEEELEDLHFYWNYSAVCLFKAVTENLENTEKKKHGAKPDKTIKKIQSSNEIWHHKPAIGQQIEHNSFHNRCIKSHKQSTVTFQVSVVLSVLAEKQAKIRAAALKACSLQQHVVRSQTLCESSQKTNCHRCQPNTMNELDL